MATALSLFPIVLLIYLMTKKNSVPSFKALPLVALILYVLKMAYFDVEANLVNATVVEGLLTALVPISIVWGAIFLFKTMEYTGAMDTIRTWLNGVTTNKVAQAMIVGWAFAFLIEGASGFGTPAAIAAPILVGLGFPAVRVAILCLIMNSVPVHFGAVGTPGWFGLGQLEGIGPMQLLEIGQKASILHFCAALVVPVIALTFALSFKEVKKNLVFVYLSILSCTVPYVIAARFDYEFPSVVAGATGLVLSAFFAQKKIGLAREEGEVRVANQVSLPALVKASFPLWGTVAILLVTRIKQLGVKPLLVSKTPIMEVSLGSFGDLSLSRSLVLSLQHIFGTDAGWAYQTLYIPALLPFILISSMAFILFSAQKAAVNRTVSESLTQMKKPVMALLGALVFVKLLMLGTAQVEANTIIIGKALAEAMGTQWKFFASYLGALGAFFSGSNTVSNLTFGGIQYSIAKNLGLNPLTILSMQSVGGGMGNMVCIHNIVAVCSVLGLSNQEGFILKRTMIPMLVYGAIVGVVGFIMLAG
ncbi:L-lactate permease [Desulfuromonas versatilis]|uniref:L-lactate permease n=1 Tax=Desulfuromonas versatilis TaxID=2802975 RepID=A0ABM8HR77_9BACT|nr:L-lactate permease [Desulfuromonas versatilis]BCR04442.1 L-lactate permease [Desulfuromonas versatilis]